jgi:hypothetical protein
VNVNSARTARTESEQRQKAHRTVNSDCPVRHGTVRCPNLSELQWSNLNGWVTWLAHRTVSGGAPDCPVRPSTDSLPNNHFGGWGYKYPQPPHFKVSKFSAIAFNTRALDFTPRHQNKRSNPLQVPNSFQRLSGLRERHLCSFEFLSLGSLFFFPILVLNTFVIKARDTKLWWSLWGLSDPID